MFGTNTYALLNINMGFPGGSVVKNPPAMQETWVLSLGWGDPLEKEMAILLQYPCLEILWTAEPSGLQFTGLQSQTQVRN